MKITPKMPLTTPDALSAWVRMKEELHENQDIRVSGRTTNMKHGPFEELTCEIHPRDFVSYQYSSSGNISCRSIAIDTIDLESYHAQKWPVNTNYVSRSIAIDTSDLDAHYEYYKREGIKLNKTAATDTRDLESHRRLYTTSNIAIGTEDLKVYLELKSTDKCMGVKSEIAQESETETQNELHDKSFLTDSISNKKSKMKGKPPDANDAEDSENDWSDDNHYDGGIDTNDNADTSDSDADSENMPLKQRAYNKLIKESDSKDKKYKKVEIFKSRKKQSADGVSSTRRFECEVCKATFTRKHSLLVHMSIHSGVRPFPCSGCGKTFSTSSQAQRHARMHQHTLSDSKDESGIKSGHLPSNTDVSSKEEDTDAAAEGLTDNTCHECSQCREKFETKQGLQQHKRSVHGSNRLRECLTCGKVFTCASALKCHETVHSGVREFACETCGKAFPTKTCLKAHEATHVGLKRFICQVCGKAFAKKDSLKVHNRKHTNERPFSCDVCGRSFDRAFTLKNHRLTHTGEKTHMCAVCGKAFSTRGALSTHERIRHNTDPDKPKVYKRRARDFEPSVCDQCGKVYSNRGNLRIHKASAHSTEKPFLCTACGRSFAKKYTLQCHARKHSNERPFPCDQCNQSFYRKSTLKTHKLRHTGARPYVCPLNCGKAFTQSSSLSYHVRHHDRTPRIANGKKRRRKKSKAGIPLMDPPPISLAPLSLVGAVLQPPPPSLPPLTLPPPPLPPPTIAPPLPPANLAPPQPVFTTASYQPNVAPPCPSTQSLAQL